MMQRQVERLCMEYGLPVREVEEKMRSWASEWKKEAKEPKEKVIKEKVSKKKTTKKEEEPKEKEPKEKVIKEKVSKKKTTKKEEEAKEEEAKEEEAKEESKKKEKVPKLPFVGIIHLDLCEGVRKNEGLYSQCEMKKKGEHYCRRCEKEGEKNGRGEPNEGNIEKRVAEGNEYRSEKGEMPVNYMKYMKKKGWSREEVEREAIRQKVTLPEKVWEETKKGRPSKVDKEKEKEDLFAKLKAESEKKESEKKESELEPEKFEEANVEEIKVRKQEYKGKTYLRDSEDRMYDPETEEEVGRWKDEMLELY